jgi:DNA primase
MNIADYLMSRGVVLEQVRDNLFKCCCLFHHELRPSMYVYLSDPEHFYCYGCDAHGDLASLVKYFEFPNREDQTVWREVFDFSRSHEIIVPDTRPYLASPHRSRPISVQETQALTIALQHFRAELESSTRAIDYLLRRGIRNPLRLPLGYASGKTFPELARKLQEVFGNLWQPIAVTCGLLWPDGGDRLKGRIFIPEIRNSQVIYYQARALEAEAEKRYLNPKNIAKSIFGLESLSWKSDLAVIVEGPFDALPMISVGMPAVAILGSKVTEENALVKAIGNKHILVATDNDAVGHQIASRLAKMLDAARISNSRIIPQVGKDLGTWAEEMTPEIVAAQLRALEHNRANLRQPAEYA